MGTGGLAKEVLQSATRTMTVFNIEERRDCCRFL